MFVLDSTPSSKILGEQGTQPLFKFYCFFPSRKMRVTTELASPTALHLREA